MRRTLIWLLGAGIASVGLVLALQAQEQQKTGAPLSAQATTTEPGAAAEQIAFTFTDDAQLKEYQDYLQERQGIFIRMQVLQVYWAEEQDRLTKLNDEIIAKYKLDPSKAYFLDPERKVLIEREAPPQTTPPVGETPGTPSPATPSQ